MNHEVLTRRQALARAGLLLGAAATGPAALLPSTQAATPPSSGKDAFRYCLNTGTIRGQKIGLRKEIEVAAAAGYQGIEPWVGSIEEYTRQGGSLKELKQRLDDLGLTVESAIGFPQWLVDEEEKRRQGMERAKYEMDLVAQIGGRRIAAPPAGVNNQPGLDLFQAAQRYRTLLEVGDTLNVVPQLEIWGSSKNLSRLGEAALVAIESGHPKACIVADVFHLYKGGSDFTGLRLLSGSALRVFHLNDYPAEPARLQANDSHRIMPGDGVAPLTQILRDLLASGRGKVLSLELFNRSYWQMDALEVARIGLAKMQAAVERAVS